MASMVKFECFSEDLGLKKHNLNSDTLKVALTNTAPNAATDETLSDIIQISATGGYTAGGYTLDNSALTRSGGVAKCTIDDETITASGASLPEFQYLVVYNATSATDALICYYDYGSGLTLADGESLSIDFDDTNGVLTLGG